MTEILQLDPNQFAGEAVIVFGSRAAGLEHAESDWDFLVIGPGEDVFDHGLDVVVVHPEQFWDHAWRDSELAGHVARWGRTLRGSEHWLEALASTHQRSLAAIEFKRRCLEAQAHALERFWPSLGPWARVRRSTKFRRDLQRHARLVEGREVPPTALIDQEWCNVDSQTSSRWLIDAGFAGSRAAVEWLTCGPCE